MEKTVDLKMSGVIELGRKELKGIEGGIVLGLLTWAAGSIAASIIQSEINSPGGISEEDYAFWYEGITGLPYEGWEGGF